MTTSQHTNDDFGDDLEIHAVQPRAFGGTWVTGTLAGHKFQAAVFRDHADCESYELGDSRISKLWVRREADQKVVANFDRGWDVRPTIAIAQQIVDFLAAGLADAAFAIQDHMEAQRQK